MRGGASAEAGPADAVSTVRTRRSNEKRRGVFIAWGSVRDRDCQIKHLDDDRLADLRRRAVPAIAAYRDGGCVPHELPRDVVVEMMAFLATGPVDGRNRGIVSNNASRRATENPRA